MNKRSPLLIPRQSGGISKDLAYSSWRHMLHRCLNPKCDAFRHYGGRGITVCDRWRSFASFRDDMGPRPSLDFSIERINNNGNYEPGNCKWGTELEQKANFRRNVYVNGKHLSAIGREAGVTHNCIQKRLRRGLDLYAPKNTFRRGQFRPRASFTDDEVRHLRELYDKGQPRGFQTRIAKEKGLNSGTVSEMLNRKTWRHLP